MSGSHISFHPTPPRVACTRPAAGSSTPQVCFSPRGQPSGPASPRALCGGHSHDTGAAGQGVWEHSIPPHPSHQNPMSAKKQRLGSITIACYHKNLLIYFKSF